MSIDMLSSIDEWGPEKIVCVSDRRSGMRGVLVIDNTARGIGKGGTRMSPTLTVTEVMRLARTMTWKWAAVDLFHGGAKAGLLGNPEGPDKEQQLRAFARALANEVPEEYVFGLDMGLSEQDAAIFVDELGSRGVAVGVPSELGGFPYDELGVTGFGVAEAVDAAARFGGVTLAGARVVIQGFGAVGRAAARRLDELGARVVAVSTSAGALVDRNGIDVTRLLEASVAMGDECVNMSGGSLPPEAALEVESDVLVPAAREDVIDSKVAGALSTRIVVEGANMPTTSGGLRVLEQRGILVVPDFIANAGGVVAAAHSMERRLSPFAPRPDDIFAMVTERLRANTTAVVQRSLESGLSTHESARRIAQERVRTAMEARGHRPPRDRVSA